MEIAKITRSEVNENNLMTYFKESLTSASTIEELKALYTFVVQKMKLYSDIDMCLDAAVQELYGEKGLEEFNEKALSYVSPGNRRPAEKKNAYVEEVLFESKREIEAMRAFGYTKEDVAPITAKFAKALFESGIQVMELHADNTETSVMSVDAFEKKDTKFGITKESISSLMEDIMTDKERDA